MPAVTFKAKVETVYNMDETIAYRRIKVPSLARRHCDMEAFRKHPCYGGWANSDLFSALLARAAKTAEVGPYIRLDRVPACASVDESGFLATVTLDL